MFFKLFWIFKKLFLDLRAFCAYLFWGRFLLLARMSLSSCSFMVVSPQPLNWHTHHHLPRQTKACHDLKLNPLIHWFLTCGSWPPTLSQRSPTTIGKQRCILRITTVATLQLWSSMTWWTVLKGRIIKKVGNHCSSFYLLSSGVAGLCLAYIWSLKELVLLIVLGAGSYVPQAGLELAW